MVGLLWVFAGILTFFPLRQLRWAATHIPTAACQACLRSTNRSLVADAEQCLQQWNTVRWRFNPGMANIPGYIHQQKNRHIHNRYTGVDCDLLLHKSMLAVWSLSPWFTVHFNMFHGWIHGKRTLKHTDHHISFASLQLLAATIPGTPESPECVVHDCFNNGFRLLCVPVFGQHHIDI